MNDYNKALAIHGNVTYVAGEWLPDYSPLYPWPPLYVWIGDPSKRDLVDISMTLRFVNAVEPNCIDDHRLEENSLHPGQAIS